ncbi:MAG: DUF1292 domain-containing protein [Lachnospiraceae bacterium]|jgi:uncharacterized protein YrzB (UPF0473 family)|nr:DUF1292 domain-containing protein [Lachnospiraceae bacterium]
MSNLNEIPEEEMSVTLDLDDGTSVECTIITILEVDGKDYIALLPMVDEEDDLYGEVWFYGYKENPDDPNEEPELIHIDDDAEYEAVVDAFDEYLDTQEFDEIIED